MVKSLSDICLGLVAAQINVLKDVDKHLTREQKEILIERLCYHDQFDSIRLPCITKYLFSPVIKTVQLTNCCQIDDSVLELIAQSGCQLRQLRIEKCRSVTDAGLSLLLKDQTKLEQLTLRSLQALTGKCLETFKSKRLKACDFKYCDGLKSLGLCFLAKNCPNIRSLNISMCFNVDSTGIEAVATLLSRNLEILKLSSVTGVKEDGIMSLAENCPNLKVMKLYGCTGLSYEAVNMLFQRCQLNVLDVSYCYKVFAGPNQLSRYLSSSLMKLVLRGVQVEKEFLIQVCEECTLLANLEVCGVTCISDETIERIADIRGDTLREIDVSWSRSLTDIGLEAMLLKCKGLEALAVGYCENISGKPFAMLGKVSNAKLAKQLKRLSIAACKQADASVLEDFIGACPNIQCLSTAGIKGMDDHILRLLSISCPKLTRINIKGCQEVTDKGVCALAVSCPLKEAVLSGIHNLTDRTIFALASTVSSSLTHLYISGCAQISPHTVTYLKDVCIKGLYVEHRTPNAAPHQLMAKNLDTGEFCRADLMY